MAGVLSALALATVFVMVPTNTAQASSKRVSSFPKKLRGYWYAYDSTGKAKTTIHKVYLHVTSNEIETSAIGEKTVKQGLYTFLTYHLDGIYHLTKKPKINHMYFEFGEKRKATLTQVGHNRWNMYSVYKYKHLNSYVIQRYALTGEKGHYRFYQEDWNENKKKPNFTKKALVPRENVNGKPAVYKYKKISNKYLRSIGIYH